MCLPRAELTFEEFAALFQKPSTTATEGEGNCLGWAAFEQANRALKPWRFTRRATGPKDVRIQVAYAGVCHRYAAHESPAVLSCACVATSGISAQLRNTYTLISTPLKSGVLVLACLQRHPSGSQRVGRRQVPYGAR